MKKTLFLLQLIGISFLNLHAQDIRVSTGIEGLHSINHQPSYIGIGANVQAEWWVKPALGLGLSLGYSTHSVNKVTPLYASHYQSLPILFLIRYPIPIFKGLYGQDGFGYTYTPDVYTVESPRQRIQGGATYYFSLGYVFQEHYDISLKIGRPRLNHKGSTANINEHQLGLRLAYIF